VRQATDHAAQRDALAAALPAAGTNRRTRLYENTRNNA